MTTKQHYFLLFLIIFFSLSVRMTYLDLPFNADEGAYAQMAKQMSQGDILYQDVIDNKTPGIFYIYWLAFEIFGYSTIAVRLFTAMYVCITILLLYYLTMLLIDKKTALLTSLFYGLFSMSPAINVVSNSEVFMVLPTLLALLFLFKFYQSFKNFNLLVVGIFMSLSYLIKQPAILEYIGFIVIIVVVGWKKRTKFRAIITQVSLLLIGFCIPLSVVLFYFYSLGALYDYYFFTILYSFNYATARLGILQTTYSVMNTFRSVFFEGILLWLPALIMVVKKTMFYKKLTYQWIILVIILGFSFIGFLSGGWPTWHYYHQLLPFICIFGSVGLIQMYNYSKKSLKYSMVFYLFLFISVILLIINNYYYFTSNSHEKIVHLWESYGDDLETIEYLQHTLKEDDVLFVLGHAGYIYFYTNTNSPTSFVTTLLGLRYQIRSQEFDNLMSQLENNSPTVIVDTGSKEYERQELNEFLLLYSPVKKFGHISVMERK